MTAPAAPQQQVAVTKESTGFGVQTMERSAELASIAIAAAAKAEVEAAYVMAIRNPRNEEDARTKILSACRSPLFAAKARYRKPQGGKYVNNIWQTEFIIGPSIRFAEEMIRCWKNVGTQQTAIYDDQTKRIVRISTRDLESNTFYSKEITLDKAVERKSAKDREILGQRANTKGELVYIVKATEDELSNKESALASKVIRNNGLRLIPQHIIDEAMALVDQVVKDKVAKDPEAERRAILDGFAKRGIFPSDLERYMGAPSAQFMPDDLVKLRDILNSIEDGHATWADYLEGTTAQATDEIKDKSQPDTKGAEVLGKLKDVAQEREVKPQEATGTAGGKETTTKAPEAEPLQPEQAQEQATTAPETTQEADDATTPIIKAIEAAERVLQSSTAGQKKYGSVLSLMKVKLSGQAKPIDVIPKEQLGFYLQQLSKAVDSLKG